MKKGVLVLLIMVSTTSCMELFKEAGRAIVNDSEEAQVSTSESNYISVGIDSLFQIDLPHYMKPVSKLHPDASFEYANIYKETYFVVIQENKYDFVDTFKQFGEYDSKVSIIENYKNVQKGMFSENVTNIKIQEYGLNEINNKPARQLKILGEIDNIKAAYIVAFIEGDTDIFMLMNWTVGNRINKFENSFEYINGSFKLIKKANEIQ